MKIVKTIGIAIVSLIALVLIAALFVSNDFDYEKSVVIDGPIDSVWQHTNSLAALEKWSPWNDYDPSMLKEFKGTDGKVGAMTSWDSKVENVGRGSQTITKIDSPSYFGTDLKFYSPFESEADGYIKLEAMGEQTKVTWGFNSEMPYPFNLMMVAMNADSTIGKDFALGLSKLKVLAEQ